MQREDWDTYFIRMAHAVSTRATCLKLHVGAVLVQDKSVRGTGYNGAPAGVASCLDLGECLLDGGRCVRSIHAEANCLLQTDASDRRGATIYVTDRPCQRCSLLIANSGIRRVVYHRQYEKDLPLVLDLFREAGIVLEQVELPDL